VLGCPRWAGSAAEALLKQDIDNGLNETMAPRDLRQSRQEHKAWPLKVFSDHIQQIKRSREESPCWAARRAREAARRAARAARHSSQYA